MAGGQLPFGWVPSGELTNYQPTLRESAADWLRQTLFTDDRAGQEKANRLTNWSETMLPPFGFATSMYDAGRAGGEGNYGTAAMIGGMAMAPLPGSKKGIRAFHGSPHSFDKFSMDKIGTGEGAQAYGHGLYFAENEGVARGYKNALSDTVMVPDGTPLIEKRLAQGALTFGGNTPEGAIAWLDKYKNGAGHVSPALTPELAATVRQKFELGDFKPGGHMYEVNIDADPNAFLDWDKPLSEQPEAVREALQKGWLAHPDVDARKTGAEIYSGLGRAEWGNTATPDGSAKALKEAGIPGIKYLDAGSRGAGDGTRNYVVFDDNLISIVRKYGIAGASAMLGYNLLDGLSEAQAAELQKYERGQ